MRLIIESPACICSHVRSLTSQKLTLVFVALQWSLMLRTQSNSDFPFVISAVKPRWWFSSARASKLALAVLNETTFAEKLLTKSCQMRLELCADACWLCVWLCLNVRGVFVEESRFPTRQASHKDWMNVDHMDGTGGSDQL